MWKWAVVTVEPCQCFKMPESSNLRKARRCWHFGLCGAARKYFGAAYKFSYFDHLLSLILFKLPNLLTNFNWGKNHHHVLQLSFGSLENNLLAGLPLWRANWNWEKNEHNPPFWLFIFFIRQHLLNLLDTAILGWMHPISEVKQPQAGLVLGWVTAWEYTML